MNDYQKVKDIIKNDTALMDGFDGVYEADVWIGLKATGTISLLEWSDGTNWIYPKPTGVDPWASNQPDNTDLGRCITMWHDSFRWYDRLCTEEKRFICNSCEGVLDKYMLYPTGSSYTTAQDYCLNTIGTSLASIQNYDDFISSQLLCETKQVDCWIGLNRLNDQGSLTSFNQFEWTDGTPYESGYSWYGYGGQGTLPWGGGGQPNGVASGANDPYCIAIDSDLNYEWNDDSCSVLYDFLCNKPSEIYYPSQWLNLYSPNSDIIFSNGIATSIDSGTAIISNKRWNNDNWPLKIEYIFQFDGNNVNENTNDGYVGVVIYHKEEATSLSICDYHFIGVEIDGNQVYSLYGQYKDYDTIITGARSTSSIFTINTSRLYKISIELVNDDPSYPGQLVINHGIEDEVSTTTRHDPYSSASNENYITSVKYIGIKNDNIAVTHQSLYISGTPEYIDPTATVSLTQCTLPETSSPTQSSGPTTDPTGVPSFDPTFDPTSDPTDVPSSQPTTATPTTSAPSIDPSTSPTNDPTVEPTLQPTTTSPTEAPTTAQPTRTDYPTTDPTTVPTSEPSSNPSKRPSFTPTRSFVVSKYGVKISIVFNYKLSSDLTVDEIKSIFTNITQNVITDSLNTNEFKNCIASKDYDITVSTTTSKTTINATIWVCDDETQTALTTEFADNLDSDFIDKTQEYSVEVNSTTIQTGASGLFIVDKEIDPEDITTTLPISGNPANNNPEEQESYVIIIAIGAGFILILCVVFAFIFFNKEE